MRQVPMAKDEPTYSEAVRAAAAEAAAALGTNPEAVRQRPIGARRRPGNNGKARVPLDVDAQKDKAAPRKPPDVQPVDARTITTLESCIADLRSLLAKAEERAAETLRSTACRDLGRERPRRAPRRRTDGVAVPPGAVVVALAAGELRIIEPKRLSRASVLLGMDPLNRVTRSAA